MKKICGFVLALLLCVSLLPAAVLADEPETLTEDNTMLNFCVDVQAGDACFVPVLWAYLNGITAGTDNVHFGPDATISRADAAVMLYRVAQKLGLGFTGAWYFPLDYSDAASVSRWADEAMHWCVMKGVIGGRADSSLAPRASATRAEAVTMLSSFCTALYGGETESNTSAASESALPQNDADGVALLLVGTSVALLVNPLQADSEPGAGFKVDIRSLGAIDGVAGEALQGKAAGVQITSNNSQPGDGVQIRVRGYSSNDGNIGPLLIVDGAPIRSLEGRVPGMNITSDGQPGDGVQIAIRGLGTVGITSPLYVIDGAAVEGVSNIPASDIEEITVLKDASSTAVIGVKGAN